MKITSKKRSKHLPLVVVGVIIAVALVPFFNVSNAAPQDTTHYPDLFTKTPFDINITLSGSQKLLRFSNRIYNFGDGPLELRPENDRKGITKAYQRIYSHNVSGDAYLKEENLVGTFGFHLTHHHWHFEKFAQYEILADINGSQGSMVRSNAKTTFCIIDTAVEPGGNDLEHFGWGGTFRKQSGWSGYRTCSKASTNGLSVGYGDTYTQNLDGQSIDITGLSDGCYWLKSTANPDKLLQEKNYDNNSGAARIFISENTVSLNCP